MQCSVESRSSCKQKERIAKTLLKQLAKAILNTPTAVKVCTVFYDIIFDKPQPPIKDSYVLQSIYMTLFRGQGGSRGKKNLCFFGRFEDRKRTF